MQKGEVFRKNAFLVNVVVNAVLGQIKPLGLLLLDEEEIPVNEEDFKEAVGYIFGDMNLGKQSFNEYDIKIGSFPKSMIKSVYNTIIPELIINMKKHHPKSGKVVLNIEMTTTTLKLTNRTKRDITKSSDIDKIFGGVDMCRDILKSLHLEDHLRYKFKSDILETYLSWEK